MIVRIMGLGQWTMEPEQLLELNDIDEAVEKAVAEGDREQLRKELQRLVEAVRSNGQEVPDDLIVESDLVLPDVDSTLEEVKELLESTSEYYGLVPDTVVGRVPTHTVCGLGLRARAWAVRARPRRPMPSRGHSRGGAHRSPSRP